MRRLRITAAVIAALLLVACVVYFAVISPVTGEDDGDAATAPETEKGESLSANDRIFMFDSVETEDIAEITVENASGGYTLVRNKDNELKFKGHETVPLNSETLAKLTNICSFTLAKTKVMSGASDEKLDEYGLLNPSASWSVTAKNGSSFRVFVGDRLLTGGGYYCMAEGRRSVYVLSEDIETTVLAAAESYVTPVLAAGISQNDYFTVDKFTVYKDGERLLRIRLVDSDKQQNPDALAENVMDYPAPYYPDSGLYYELIYSYMGLTADSCYKLGADGDDLAAAGLDEPAHVISYEYQGEYYEMRFSEKDAENGTYYAVSNFYPDVIGTVSAEDFKYLEYGLLDWTDKYVFQQYITNLSEFSVKTPKLEATFRLAHSVNEQGANVLNVTCDGRALSESEIPAFREYYKTFLALKAEDYAVNDEFCTMSADELEAFTADESNCYLRFEYTELDGSSAVICTYPYSTRHSVITVNGVGGYYIASELAGDIESGAKKIINAG